MELVEVVVRTPWNKSGDALGFVGTVAIPLSDTSLLSTRHQGYMHRFINTVLFNTQCETAIQLWIGSREIEKTHNVTRIFIPSIRSAHGVLLDEPSHSSIVGRIEQITCRYFYANSELSDPQCQASIRKIWVLIFHWKTLICFLFQMNNWPSSSKQTQMLCR